MRNSRWSTAGLRLFSRWLSPRRRPRPAARPLEVEALEERAVPTVVSPTYLFAPRRGETPAAGTSGPTGYIPSQLAHAYGFDQVFFNGLFGDGSGQTIAVVDAGSDPYLAADLHAFDVKFGLPDPVLTQVSQTGSSTLPGVVAGWPMEIDLDVEWAHAMAPGARILYVGANTAEDSDMYPAVNYAATTGGASVVSMSWGAGEDPSDVGHNSLFTQPGVTYVGSSGDAGSPPIYPSSSPNVLAIGGTTVLLNSDNSWAGETGWPSSGGGISFYQAQPSYQKGLTISNGSGTVNPNGFRTTPDVAYNASLSFGVSVYDLFDLGPSTPWAKVGGTSAGAPQWSALVAIADQGRALAQLGSLGGASQTLPAVYALPASDFHDLTSGTSTGSPPYSAGPGYDLVTGLGSPVANLVISNLVNYGAPVGPQPVDPGFETPSVGTGSSAYQYDPSGSPWTFGGNAGLAGNGSAFTGANPAAPQGTQVAFIQAAGSSASQSVTFSAGTYVVSFSAAQRGSGNASSQAFQVTVDGSPVGTFTPSGTSYATYMTASFSVTDGAHTIAFVGLNPNGGDNTAFVDNVVVYSSGAQFADPGFESPRVGSGAYLYAPASSSWSFSGGAGLAGNGSAFTGANPGAPQGSQVVFLQGSGSVSQSVGFPAGTYAVYFKAAQRANNQATFQTIQVQVDGTTVGTVTPSGTSYQSYTSASFTVTAGAHTVTFVGTNPNGGDNTAFLDQVAVYSSGPQLADPGFEGPGLGTGGSAYRYSPAGSPWTFVGSAGLAGNGSGFTAGNPGAPQGTQVAFIQGTGSAASQSASFPAGTYTVSFSAAQRGNGNAGAQTIQVTVDGIPVGTFTPTGTAYATYASASFTVTAGAHTIAFVGLNPNGGDNTAFLDNVTVTASGAQLADPGFESPGVGSGSSAYRYDPVGSSWNFLGNAGVSGNGSAFTAGNPGAPQGSQVAFLQQSGSTISQSASFLSGNYTISLSAAQRAGNDSSQSFQVTLDGRVVGTVTATGTTYATYITNVFNVTAGTHTIAFIGINPNGGDNTALIDQVVITRVG